ncbi:hypothetical protein ES708_23880 [subsurface metagenome]
MGIGFQPSVVIFVAADSYTSSPNFSWGFDTLTQRYVIFQGGAAPYSGVDVNNSIYIKEAGGDTIKGVISALGSDGFTITFTEIGAAQAYCTYLCLP